jgi:hypothetical protein
VQYGIDQLMAVLPVLASMSTLDTNPATISKGGGGKPKKSPGKNDKNEKNEEKDDGISGKSTKISSMMDLEHAICNVEVGWLYLTQSEFMANVKDDSIREHAAIYFETAIEICRAINAIPSVSTGAKDRSAHFYIVSN